MEPLWLLAQIEDGGFHLPQGTEWVAWLAFAAIVAALWWVVRRTRRRAQEQFFARKRKEQEERRRLRGEG